MNLLSKYVTFFLVVFISLMAVNYVFAQEEIVDPEVQAQIESLLAEEGELVALEEGEEGEVTFTVTAQVNVYAGMVTEQRDHDFIVEFELVNNGNLEPEVLYAVQLYKATDSGEMLVHEKVYAEVLSLESNTTLQKQVAYTAPSTLEEGEYIVRILASNKKGFEYGGTTVGTYTITDQRKEGELYIDQAECFLVIEGVDDTTVHGREIGVDINTSEDTLFLQCDGVVFTDESIGAQFTFRERSSFGDVLVKTTVPFGDITFLGEEGNEGMYVHVPTLPKPQSYLVTMTLVENEDVSVSNEVVFRYVAQGDSATIKNISLDKSAYKAGEEAKVKVIVSGLADVFPEARGRDLETYDFENNPIADFQVRLQITGKGGVVCSEEQIKTLPAYNGELYDIAVPITNDCEQPTITAEIVNAQGTVLHNASFDVTVPSEQKSEGAAPETSTSLLEKIVLIISVILLVGVVGMYLYHNFKKNPEIPLAVLFLIVGLGLAGLPENASADSFFMSYFSWGATHPIYYTGWYQLADNSINCGDSITGDSRINLSACDNLELSTKLYIAGGEVYSNYHTNTHCHSGGGCGNWSIDSGWKSRNVGNKTSNGSVVFDYRLQRISNEKGFTHTISKALGYSVGPCVNFTANVGTPSSCVRTGQTTADVAVSITSPTVAVAQYGFKCGPQAWVWKATNTHTCTFDYSGSFAVQTGIKNSGGTTLLTKSSPVTVLECPCALPTSNLTVDGQTGTVVVDQGSNYSVDWSFSNPGESYTCTLTAPPEAMSSGQTGTSLMGGRLDVITTLRAMSTASTNYVYTYSCVGTGSCAPISKTVNVQVNASPFTVTLEPDSGEFEIGEAIEWKATASGGYPPYYGLWSGDVVSPWGPLSNITRRYGSVGVKNVRLDAGDSDPTTPGVFDTGSVTIIDSRIQQ
jgi:hypothetical protein